MTRGLARSLLAAGIVCALAATAHAQMAKLEWSAEGYYRTRAVFLTNLAPEPRTEVLTPIGTIVQPNIRSTSYMIHRLRLSPQVSYGNLAKLYLQLDGLDDVLWGDNNGVASAPLFAVNPSDQSYLGGPQVDTFKLTRAWIEFQIPVGLLRVGRMPSHWGMGLLANGGGSGNWDPTSPRGEPKRKVQDYYFDEDFGDNHFGSTNDRILFATRPLSILKTIQKKADTSSNIIFAYAFDKISESPWLVREDDRQIRPFGQQGFVSRGSKEDDVNEHVFVLAYSNPDWDQIAFTDELKFGTYQVIRTQEQSFTNPSEPPSTDPSDPDYCDPAVDPRCTYTDDGSFVWIADFWYRLRYGPWYSEAEYFHIGGESTGGVPFPAPNLKSKADIHGLAARFGYLTELVDGVLEVGWSSGDSNLASKTLSQRPLHPDYNVGLILYEEVLRERSARVFGPPFIGASPPNGATGFFSNGGVVGSWYVHPKVRWRPADWGIEVVGALLLAFVDEWGQAPSIFVKPNDAGDGLMDKLIGTEIDLAVKSRFADNHIDVSLEAGYLIFGDVLKTHSYGSGMEFEDAPSGAFSLQARVAMIF
jgi:hypothetical protein